MQARQHVGCAPRTNRHPKEIAKAGAQSGAYDAPYGKCMPPTPQLEVSPGSLGKMVLI